MNLKVCILSALFLSGSLFCLAEETVFSGKAEDYLPGAYEISTILNPVTLQEVKVGELLIDPDNTFIASFNIDRNSWVFLNIGIYKMLLFAVPGTHYTIELPPAIEKSEKQILNPYFEPTPVHLKVLESNLHGRKVADLNEQLYCFDTLFFAGSEKIMLKKYNGQAIDAKAFIAQIEKNFENDSSSYFRNYRGYRYGLLELSAAETGLADIRKLYIPFGSPAYMDPAYMELFNKMFDEFLVYYGRTDDGREVIPAINKYHNLDMLRASLRKHPAILSDTIADLVIMKDLYSQFFKETFYRESIIAIIDSIIARPAIPAFSVLAGEIKNKLTRLVPGNSPPDFELRGMNGASWSLKDFRGSYVYLVFCTPDNYSCMIEYPYLRSYNEKHSKYLSVVNIMVCDTYEQMTEFMEKNNYTWQSLFYGDQPGVLIDYDVRIFPACYLIGPDGMLIQAPAKLPSEGFEQNLFKIMRSRGDI